MSASAEQLIQIGLLGEALEQGPVAVFVFDDELNYIAVNEHACKLVGYTREELLHLRAPALSASPKALDDYREVVLGRRSEGTTRVICKDGTELDLRFRASQTRVAGMTFYVGVAWPADDTAQA
jgi:PAS domain S-box-containing protein